MAVGVTPGILLAWPRFADKQITRKEAGFFKGTFFIP